MITFLHAADLHLDAPFSGLSPAQAAKRREEQLELVRELFEQGNERGCTLALLAGDLFDAPEVRPDTLEQVQRACAGFHGPIFIAPGNHDCCKPGGVYSIGGWPENVHIFTSRDISRVELPDCTVYGAGFAQVCENAMLDGFHAENMESALVMGALLGALHVAVRPILRVVSIPLGCLTLGLIQPLIDLALLYLCDHAVAGFSITSPLHAVIAVMLINTISFIAAGRR